MQHINCTLTAVSNAVSHEADAILNLSTAKVDVFVEQDEHKTASDLYITIDGEDYPVKAHGSSFLVDDEHVQSIVNARSHPHNSEKFYRSRHFGM